MSIDDVIDFTPELREEALDIINSRARFGPIFSPPVLRGAETPFIQVPGAGGGANWQGAAVDPETGMLYVSSSSTLIVVEVIAYDPPATVGYFTDPWGYGLSGPRGLPIFKPPYKRVTAIDLNTGDHAWQVPHGDGPRNHPAIAHLDPGPLGGGGRDQLRAAGDADAAHHEPRGSGRRGRGGRLARHQRVRQGDGRAPGLDPAAHGPRREPGDLPP